MTTSLLLLLFAASLDVPASTEAPLLAGSTGKSVQEFGECFLAAQQRNARPVWLVAHDDGARISNEGAAGVVNPYRIRFIEGRSQNQLKVFFDRKDGTEEPVLKAVRSCW